jgi:hypothetical protein
MFLLDDVTNTSMKLMNCGHVKRTEEIPLLYSTLYWPLVGKLLVMDDRACDVYRSHIFGVSLTNESKWYLVDIICFFYSLEKKSI